jgi:Lon protease-like protein
MATVPDFPLFPLGIVALPSELVPLHIFEERYKTMIARCLEEPTEFGIVLAGEDGLHPVACACTVEQVLERLPDGRVNLVARGTRAIHIERAVDHLPYPAGEVTVLEDADDEVDPELLGTVQDAYAQLVRDATEKDPDLTEIAAMGAYDIAATVEFGLEAKQNLLELRSEQARLDLLLRLLRAALRRLDLAGRAEARAKSNGKVRF